MSIREFTEKLGNTIKEIEETRSSNAVKIALDSIALVKRRVINTGKDKDGNQFGEYSRAVVPFWYYYGKETNRNNKSAVQDLLNRYGYFASYKDWRTVNNLPTAFINFSFTNKFWNSLEPLILDDRGNRTVLGIAPRSFKEEQKLEHQNARFGDILALSKSEIALISAANEARLTRAFKNNGLL